MTISFVLLLSLSAAPQRIALMDFETRGARPELGTAISGVVANEIQRLAVFQVTTADSVRAVISLERQRELLGGAGESSTLSELSSLLGVDHALRGKVTGQGNAFTLELVLDDARSGKREGSDVELAASPGELLAESSKAVSKVLSKLLSTQTGRLVVLASEPGATVKLDDRPVGATPLPGPLSIPAGPHELVLEKAGFIAVRKDTRVQRDELTEETVTLVPSPDYVNDYEGKQQKLRLGAWIASGAAIVGAGATIFFQARADQIYGAVGTPNTFLDARAKLLAGDERERTQATSLQAQVGSNQSLSYVAAGVGALGAAAAVVLWIVGDDPGRYSRFKTVVAPAAGGGVAGAVAWRF